MGIGIQIVQTVLYVGLALMVFKIVVMPSIVDIVKQCQSIKKDEGVDNENKQ